MKIIGLMFLVIGLFIVSSIILAFPTMWLWNYIMPDLFGLSKINIYQAMAINFLSSILFKANVSINNKK